MRILLASLAIVCGALTGCQTSAGAGGPADSGSAPTDLQRAVKDCWNPDTHRKFELADAGRTLAVSGVATQDDYATLVCYYTALGTPSSVIDLIDQTTPVMGRQTSKADGLSYAWSYDGTLDMVVTE